MIALSACGGGLAFIVHVREHDCVPMNEVTFAHAVARPLLDDFRKGVHVASSLVERVAKLSWTASGVPEPVVPVVSDTATAFDLKNQQPVARMKDNEVGLAFGQGALVAPRPEPGIGMKDREVVGELVAERCIDGRLRGVLELGGVDIGDHACHRIHPIRVNSPPSNTPMTRPTTHTPDRRGVSERGATWGKNKGSEPCHPAHWAIRPSSAPRWR